MVQQGASPIVKMCEDQRCAWPNAEVCVFRFRRVRQVPLRTTNQNSFSHVLIPFSRYSAVQEKEKIVKEVVKQESAVTALQAIARAPSQVHSEQQCAACAACHGEMVQIQRTGGQRVRRQWRARAMQKAQVESNVPSPQPNRVIM